MSILTEEIAKDNGMELASIPMDKTPFPTLFEEELVDNWLGKEFTAEDITDVVGRPMDFGCPSNNGIGAIMRRMAKRHKLRVVGIRKSRGRAKHRSNTILWR